MHKLLTIFRKLRAVACGVGILSAIAALLWTSVGISAKIARMGVIIAMVYKTACQYCNTLIDSNFLFCPFCGRAQQDEDAEEDSANSENDKK